MQVTYDMTKPRCYGERCDCRLPIPNAWGFDNSKARRSCGNYLLAPKLHPPRGN